MTIYYNLTYVKLDSRYSSVITFGICPCDYMQEFNRNFHHIIHLSDCEILLSTQQFFFQLFAITYMEIYPNYLMKKKW